jgi:hypothetical protein
LNDRAVVPKGGIRRPPDELVTVALTDDWRE